MQNTPHMPRCRPLTVAGLTLVFAALVLSMLPWFAGIGLAWSLFMLGGVALVARPMFLPTFAAAARWRALLDHPLLPVGFALLAAAVALQHLAIELVSVLWLLAALLLVVDQARSMLVERGYQRFFHWGQLWRGGMGRLLVLGVVLCALSLFSTWSSASGGAVFGWIGGTRLVNTFNPITGGLDLQVQYDPFLYPNNRFWPGFTFSGRAHAGAVWVNVALIGLVIWAAVRWREVQPTRWRWLGPVLTGFLIAWWLPHMSREPAVLVFLGGLAAINIAVFKMMQT